MVRADSVVDKGAEQPLPPARCLGCGVDFTLDLAQERLALRRTGGVEAFTILFHQLGTAGLAFHVGLVAGRDDVGGDHGDGVDSCANAGE